MILQIIGAFVSVLCFSIILEVPRKYLLYTSATGSLGWLIYLVVLRVENSTIMGSLISAIVVAPVSYTHLPWRSPLCWPEESVMYAKAGQM